VTSTSASASTEQTVLAPGRDAPRAAREFADGVLGRWRLPSLAAPVELVVSELVTNAVRHAGTAVTVRLTRVPEGLLVEVDDAGAGHPHVVAPLRRSVGGHGLAIVERLADAWGHEDRGDGKTVWARLCLPGDMSQDGDLGSRAAKG
jgi:anti-sigma regulatory factor (Ser/Thr protein kinase)